MTKKNFIALGDCIRAARPVDTGTAGDSALIGQWQHDVNALANFCGSQNSRFDRGRWLEYVYKDFRTVAGFPIYPRDYHGVSNEREG